MIAWLDTAAFLVIWFLLLAGILGAVLGSFANAWAWRIVNNESIARGRSHCTSCGHTLGTLDLIPIFSYLFLRGRCRYCGEKIAARYFRVELILALFFMSIVFAYDPWSTGWELLRFAIVGFILLIIALVDWDTYEIKNGFLVGIAVVFAIFLPVSGGFNGLWSGLLGALLVPGFIFIFVLIAEKIMKKEAMGGGDIKLFAVLGLHFGTVQMLFLLIASCFVGIIMFYLAKRDKEQPMPFAPAICLGAWITMLIGEPFINWYLSLLF